MRASSSSTSSTSTGSASRKSAVGLGRATALAALTTELFDRQRGAVVGFDMLFAEPDTGTGLPKLERVAADAPGLAARLGRWRVEPDHDAAFARALDGRTAVPGFCLTSDRDAHQVGVLPAPVFDAAALHGRAVATTQWDGYAANLAVLAHAAPSAGFFNAVADADGQVRSVPLIAELGGRYFEPLALAVFRTHTGAPRVLPGFVPPSDLPNSPPRLGQALDRTVLEQGASRSSLPVESMARARVPFRRPGGPHGGPYEDASAVALLNHRIAAGHLAGTLVRVGTGLPGSYHPRSTPMAEVYPRHRGACEPAVGPARRPLAGGARLGRRLRDRPATVRVRSACRRPAAAAPAAACVDPKNRSYPVAVRVGGGVGRANWPTILRQM